MRPATPPPKSPARWLAIGGLLIAGAIGAALGIQSSKQPDAPKPHVLADPASVLACPIFKASADKFGGADVGWLGASAAQLACERAQLVLGSSMRTKGPPELLGLSRMPSNDFPTTPYVGVVRDKTVEAAASATAWLDGSVELRGNTFYVDMSLHARDGGIHGQGQSSAATLGDAVRKAFESLGLPSRTKTLEWYGGASVSAALLFHDVEWDILVENPATLREDCSTIAARQDVGGMAGYVRTICAAQLGEPLPPPPAIDSSTLAALTISASTLRLHPIDAARQHALEDAARTLETRIQEAETGDARAIVAATAAEIWYAIGNADEARRLALVAVESSPKLVDLRGTPWHRLAFTSTDQHVLASHAAWIPWEPFGQANVTRNSMRDGASLEGTHRAAILARGGYWLESYGHTLVLNGDLVKADSVAAIAGDPTIDVELTAAAGNMGKALLMANDRLMKMPSTSAMSRKATYLALAVAELGAVLERSPPPAMEDFVTRFIEVDPPVLTHGVVPLFNTLGACLLSKNVTSRCLVRLHALYAHGYFGAALGPIGQVLDGADAYAAGNWKSAAALWRTMFLTSIFTTEALRDVVTNAFERAGELELAEKNDLPALDAKRPLSLAFVRAAERAEKRGDLVKAKEYAQRVVDKWSASDERPPCVDRMRKILAK